MPQHTEKLTTALSFRSFCTHIPVNSRKKRMSLDFFNSIWTSSWTKQILYLTHVWVKSLKIAQKISSFLTSLHRHGYLRELWIHKYSQDVKYPGRQREHKKLINTVSIFFAVRLWELWLTPKPLIPHFEHSLAKSRKSWSKLTGNGTQMLLITQSLRVSSNYFFLKK